MPVLYFGSQSSPALLWSLCIKSQIPSTKFQINLKFQILNRFKVIVWDFEFRSLLFVCFLGFVIWNFNKSMSFQKSKPPVGITKAWFLLTRILYFRLYVRNTL